MAIMLAFSVACSTEDTGTDEDDDSSTETTDTITDYQLIKNGDFEFGTDEDTAFPYSSSINWSRSLYSDVTSAPSSNGTSGIIDTTDEEFNDLDTKNKPSVNPSNPGSLGLVASEYDYEDEDLQVKPQVDGTKILMLNNKKNGEGTAQYYRASSSISVGTGEYAKLSFWVNTLDLKSLYTSTPGLHIRLSSTTGSTSYEEFVIEGIDTKGEWAKFEVYIEGSEVSSTTLNLTFGLGRGNGVDHNEFVEGFAFFDNVHVEMVEKKDFPASSSADKYIENPNSIESVSLAGTTYIDNATTDEVKFTTYKVQLNYNVLPTTTRIDGTQSASIKYSDVIVKENGVAYDYSAGNYIGTDIATASDNVKAIVGTNNFDNIVYMDFANPSSATYQTQTYTLASESYNLVSFLVRTESNNPNSNKLKIKVVNEDNDDAEIFASIDTTDLESARYGEWIMYRAFINNPTGEETSYSIKFIYGFDGEWDDVHALQQGYAIIANLNVYSTDEDFYSLSTVSDYLVKHQVYGKYKSFGTETDVPSNDSYVLVVDKTQEFSVKEKPATNVSGYTFYTGKPATSTYGIVNSKYHDGGKAYGTTNKFEFAQEISAADFDNLKSGTNKNAQVIVLDNKEADYSRFVTEVKTVSANTSSKVVVKVRAFGTATATVSLVESTFSNGKYNKLNFITSDTDTGVTLSSEVTANSYKKGGWTYVYFYVTAGNEDIEYRVEVSNGTADNLSVGSVFTEGVTATSIDASLISTDKRALEKDFMSLDASYEFATKTHKRAPTTVLYTENGEDKEKTITYDVKEVYAGNNFVKFVDYSTIDADDVIDQTTDEEESTEDTTEEEGYTLNTDATLQITSIVIALVLIAVILVIIIRNIVSKRRKRKQKTASYYEETSGFDRNSREKTLRKIAEKKAKLQEVELSDDEEEYDYTITEVMEDDTDATTVEEVVEDTTEEVVEESTETCEEIIENATAEEVVEESSEDKAE